MDPKPLLVGPHKCTVPRLKAFLKLISNLGLVCLWASSEMGITGLRPHQKALLYTINSLNMDPKPLLVGLQKITVPQWKAFLNEFQFWVWFFSGLPLKWGARA